MDTTLALSDTHHYHSLRKACVAFLALSNKVGSAVASQEVYLQLNDNDRTRPAMFLSGTTFKDMRKWMCSRPRR